MILTQHWALLCNTLLETTQIEKLIFIKILFLEGYNFLKIKNPSKYCNPEWQQVFIILRCDLEVPNEIPLRIMRLFLFYHSFISSAHTPGHTRSNIS